MNKKSEEYRIFLGLGGNEPETPALFPQIIKSLADWGRIELVSSLYSTQPQDYVHQASFLNAVISMYTGAPPEKVLETIQILETRAGRKRLIPKGPRTIDIDMLLYGNNILDTEWLTVPHPRMHQRRFVLEPLVEIAPDLCHPVTGIPFRDYLEECKTQGIYSRTPLIYTI